ncbi:MAG: excinuclease ABC subunit UvrC [Nitrospirae bacterium]|nr:excinuclease ABC subunit UvrC [Nitrospirota bacterium]
MRMVTELSNTPRRPGVYIFKGQKGQVLYVGKAKDLRNRLRSYFRKSANLEPRKAAMVRMIKDFSYIVTANELEALILEASLIKQHKPNFNIILRDDKNYPYIKLTVTEEWPRAEVVRGIKRDGNIYFGPYIPAQAMWEALAFIRRNFQVRPCNYTLDKPMRPCIQHEMKKCPAPCAGKISKKEYMDVVEEVKLFLSGEKKGLLNSLERKMQIFSEQMRYEEAAVVRDSITSLSRAFESQKVIAPELGDIDVIGFYREGETVAINVLFLRKGVLIGAKDFYLEKVLEENEHEIMRSVIELFYAKDIIPPSLILVGVLPTDREAITGWLRDKRGAAIKMEVPRRGKKRDLLKMADENAGLHLAFKKKSAGDDTMQILKERLHLEQTPVSVGAFDVSTIQGSESVGAFVFWEHGTFKKGLFRHLKIKETQGVDDYAMMREIVLRTLKNLEDKVPDLIIIDGGKGQLEVAQKAMEEAGLVKDIVGVAKKPDRAFLRDGGIVDLEDKNKASLLLKRIRDEVHRFAISFHRKLRDKKLMDSPLTRIPGIGMKRRLELLRHFGSLEGIRSATSDEIANIKGFNRKVAERLIEELRQ